MINIGLLKQRASGLLAEAYAAGRPDAAETTYQHFLGRMQASPVLMREYLVHQNLQRQGLSESEASRFLDLNLRAMRGVLREEREQAHASVADLCCENCAASPLDEAIHTLLNETLQRGLPEPARLRRFQDARQVVLESLTAPIPVLSQAADPGLDAATGGFTTEELLAGAGLVLEQKLAPLTEQERRILSVLASHNPVLQEALYLELYEAAELYVESLSHDECYPDARQRLNEMSYNPAQLMENVLDLYELVHGE